MHIDGFRSIFFTCRANSRITIAFVVIAVSLAITAAGCGDQAPQAGQSASGSGVQTFPTGKPDGAGETATGQSAQSGSQIVDQSAAGIADQSAAGIADQSAAGIANLGAAATVRGGTSAEGGSGTEGAPAQSTQIIRMARIPFRNARELVITHEPMMKYLAVRLGVAEVKLVSAPDYRGIVDLLKSGRAEMAWMGTFNYIDAYAEAGVETIVRPKRFGKSTYGGLIIVHVDSGINSVADLKGKSFAFVDRKSASGYLFPFAALIENGINPESDFSSIQYLKQHDSVCMAVLYRKIDAGAVYDDARKKLKSEEQARKLKVIKSISDIPNEPIVVTKTLSPEIKKALKEAFISLSTENPEGAEVLNTFNKVCADSIDGFEISTDSDYDYIRQIDKILKQHLKDDGEASSSESTGKSEN